jgi:hypothetical protein
MKLNPLNQTFGLPPSTYVSDSLMLNSMPVMRIIPGKPNFESGLTLFRVDDDWSTYHKVLDTLGYQLSAEPIKLAFLADNFPTDTFTNEYGETFLQKFTDVASQGMQQMAQMTGSRTFTEATGKLGAGFSNIGENTEGMLGDIIKGAGTGFSETGKALQNLKANMQSNQFLSGAANTIDKMMGGYRVDFPQIWRNSGFTPSYTATVRLYNPNPGNALSTSRHIIGPLAVILCLAIPRSDDGKTFNWPFFHKIKAPGIYNLDPAVITNITVVKGGDQQQIAYNQQLSMVDVRLDFTSLYSTMVLEETKSFQQQRPTVKNYLENMLGVDNEKFSKRSSMRTKAGNAAGATTNTSSITISAIPNSPNAAQTNSAALTNSKIASSINRQAPTVTDKEVTSRVSSDKIATQSNLAANTPPGLLA